MSARLNYRTVSRVDRERFAQAMRDGVQGPELAARFGVSRASVTRLRRELRPRAEAGAERRPSDRRETR